MNIKFRINKILESGLWWQFLLFAIFNFVVFVVCLVIYLALPKLACEPYSDIGIWQALRLFVDSNSIIDETSFTKQSIALLFLECMGTILFSGLIVAIITNVMDQRVGDIKEGKVHYKLKNHIVIIGYDDIVSTIMKEIVNDSKYNHCKIVLQTNGSISEIKNTLLNKLAKSDLKRVVVYYAPRQSVEELQHLCTIYAKEVFIVGDREQSDHDAENMDTFGKLVEIHQKNGKQQSKPLTIWFENEASYTALQLNEISLEWKKYFEFRPYNFYKRWANRLLTNSGYGTGTDRIKYPELDHEGIKENSTKHVHLVIVGMNRMGTALAKEAAHLMHFPNFDEKTGKNKTRITFIDDNADVEKNFFIGRHAGYFDIAPVLYADLSESNFVNFQVVYRKKEQFGAKNFLDIQFEFIKGRVESEFVREWIRKELKDEDAITTIAICLHNPSQSFGMAMYLPEEVYTRGRDDMSRPWEIIDKDKVINIFVRQEKTGSLIKSFGDAARSSAAMNKKYANIYPFGMVDDSFAFDYSLNHLAMAFNYIYCYYFTYNTLPSCFPSVDELLDKWKLVSTAEKWSNLYLADSIEFKLRSVGYDSRSIGTAILSEEQIEKIAYTEHSRWNMEKLLMGYRPLSESEKKEKVDMNKLKKNMFAHYLIKPYMDLTNEQKELDRNIIKELPDILRMLSKG